MDRRISRLRKISLPTKVRSFLGRQLPKLFYRDITAKANQLPIGVVIVEQFVDSAADQLGRLRRKQVRMDIPE